MVTFIYILSFFMSIYFGSSVGLLACFLVFILDVVFINGTQVYYNNKLAKKFLRSGVVAITIGSKVFTPRDELSHEVLKHERMHVEQYKKYGVTIFIIMYITNYLWNLIKYRDKQKAYEEIRFEREARHFASS